MRFFFASYLKVKRSYWSNYQWILGWNSIQIQLNQFICQCFRSAKKSSWTLPMKMLLKVQNGGRKKLRTGEIKCAKTTARHTIQSLICSRIKMGETSQEKLGQLRVRQIPNVITTISIDFCRSNSFLSFFFFFLPLPIF